MQKSKTDSGLIILHNIAILGYGCTTSLGPATADLWEGLVGGRDASSRFDENFHAYVWQDNRDLNEQLQRALRQALDGLDKQAIERIRDGSKLGVILASTKGAIDDFIWNASEAELLVDPYTRFLESFLARAELKPERLLTVSNACASSLSAVFLARQWLVNGIVSDVIVLAVDRVGPFVLKGFGCLRALTTEKVRPFAKARSGLRLGDAAAAIVLSRAQGVARLEGVGIDAEGISVTRPAAQSLKRACEKIPNSGCPDLIIAHGTATPINDPIEDQVFSALFAAKPAITATKWAVGHTLGASGAIDLIAACEAMKNQRAFCIANTDEVDPAFKGRYLLAGADVSGVGPINRVLVTSLGFGGIHAAAALSRGGTV